MSTLDSFYEQVRNLQHNNDTLKYEDRSDDSTAQFVIETRQGKQHIEEALRRFDSQYEIEPVFRTDNDNDDPSLGDFYLYRVLGVKEQDLETNLYDVAYALREQFGFESAEPDLHFSFIDRDSKDDSKDQSNKDDHGWALQAIKMAQAWNLTPPSGGAHDGEGIAIAHLDTGWTDHEDLDAANFDTSRFTDMINPGGNAEDPLDYGWNQGHGTKTGSVMMSKGGLINGDQTTPPGKITGVARSCDYVSVRCIKKVWFIRASHIARAIHAATNLKVDVISMSLGGLMLRAMRKAVENAAKQQIILCAAAGNRVKFVVYPARYRQTIGVAASNRQNTPWSGSSRGKRVDITAPGEDVWHALPGPKGDEVDEGSGTSYGTAHMAGVAAVWLSFFGKQNLLNTAQAAGISLQKLFRNCLQQTADDQNGQWNTRKYGAGIVDVEKLLSTPPGNVVANPTVSTGGTNNPSNPGDKDVGKRLVKLLTNRLNDESQAAGFENEINNIMLLNPSDNGLFEDFESSDNEKLAREFYEINKNEMSETLSKMLNQILR